MSTTVLDQSIDHLTKATRFSPSNASYQALLAEALLRDGDVDGGLAAVERALEKQSPPRIFFLAAYGLALAGRWQQVDRFADEALAASPAFDRALYIRGRARFELRQHDAALRDFMQACAASDAPEYRRAAARAALSSRPSVSHDVLRRVLELFHGAYDDDGRPDESVLLVGLLHLALEEPEQALQLLDRVAAPDSGHWKLLREACREATGREARPQAARDEALFAVATDSGEDLAPRPSSRVQSWGIELSWPDPSLPALGLLRHGLHRIRGRADERSADDPTGEAWWLNWRSGRPSGRSRTMVEAGGLLQEGRQLLTAGQADAAVAPLEQAWRMVAASRLSEPSLQSLLQGIAESLAVARTRRQSVSPSAISDEELYDAGARYRPFLEQLVRRILVREERSDLTALEIYVTSIEQEAIEDRGLRRHTLRSLAQSLRLELSSSKFAVEPRIDLLQRIHRARPGLAFPRLYLGYFHYRMKEYEVAAVLWQGLRGRLANTPRLLLLQARCAEMTGDKDLALKLLRASIAAKEAQPHAHYHLGRLLMLGEDDD